MRINLVNGTMISHRISQLAGTEWRALMSTSKNLRSVISSHHRISLQENKGHSMAIDRGRDLRYVIISHRHVRKNSRGHAETMVMKCDLRSAMRSRRKEKIVIQLRLSFQQVIY